jgi:hypothetical protein
MKIPSVDKAGAIAVKIAEGVTPTLTAKEQAMFIAGFQECIKYLKTKKTMSKQVIFYIGYFCGAVVTALLMIYVLHFHL